MPPVETHHESFVRTVAVVRFITGRSNMEGHGVGTESAGSAFPPTNRRTFTSAHDVLAVYFNTGLAFPVSTTLTMSDCSTHQWSLSCISPRMMFPSKLAFREPPHASN